jgi:hypothetical protein
MRSVVSTKRVYVMKYLMTHPCVDCREAELVLLEFDHVRGSKKYGINTLLTNNCSIVTLVAEIDKCEVRCANCHRRKTADTHGNYRLEILGELESRIVPQKPRKLNKELADEMRARYVRGAYGASKLAKEYGVCRSTVRAIIAGKYYK